MVTNGGNFRKLVTPQSVQAEHFALMTTYYECVLKAILGVIIGTGRVCLRGIDSATVDSTVDRPLFPDCRQACFTVDSDTILKIEIKNNEERLFLCLTCNYEVIISAKLYTLTQHMHRRSEISTHWGPWGTN